MSRFRLYPTPEQEVLLLEQCGHARYVWNLGLEQRLMWRRWQGPTPGLAEQHRQLTQARAAVVGGPVGEARTSTPRLLELRAVGIPVLQGREDVNADRCPPSQEGPTP